MAINLDNLAAKAKLPVFRKAIVDFFDVLDTCFGIRSVQFGERASQLKSGFLTTIASIFHAHTDFWKPGTFELSVDASMRRKLASFPINDPEVGRLAGGSGAAVLILRSMLIEHLNKGKRTGRLHPRNGDEE